MYAGGLVGQFFFGSIKDCLNSASVDMTWVKEGADLDLINQSLKEGATPFESLEEFEASFENAVGGIAAQLEGTVAENVCQAGAVSGKYGSFGVLAGLASTENPDCSFVNCHALSSVENGWYSYSSETDESGKYINLDESGSLIKEARDAADVYQSVEDMYALAATLGDAFVAKGGALPAFAWEE